MEKYNATINRVEDRAELVFHLDGITHTISLTEDNPNEIKMVFNELIQHLKGRKYSFELDDDKDDLYTGICKEYLKHLNSEISIIYGQLKAYDLLDKGSA